MGLAADFERTGEEGLQLAGLSDRAKDKIESFSGE